MPSLGRWYTIINVLLDHSWMGLWIDLMSNSLYLAHGTVIIYLIRKCYEILDVPLLSCFISILRNLLISPSSLRIKFSYLVCINGQFWSISCVCDYIQSLTCVKTIPSCSVLDWKKEAYFRPWRFLFKLNIQCLCIFVFGLLTLHRLEKYSGLE